MLPSRRDALNTLISGPAAAGLYRRIELLRTKLPTTFGSAAWATLMDLHRGGLLERAAGRRAGPIIGCVTPAEVGGRDIRYLFANGDTSLITIAPTGAGKSSGQAITNLLANLRSAYVLDFKNELWEQTAAWRAANGHDIIRFAPFHRNSAHWNPIDYINDGCGNAPNDMRRQENTRFLANLLLTPNPRTTEPYFDNAAKSFLETTMLFVATEPLNTGFVRERTMAEVYRLIARQEPLAFKETLSAMAKSHEEIVQQGACTMLHMEPAREQLASVKTVLIEHLKIWSYRRVQEVTARSDFSFKSFRRRGPDSRPMTFYYSTPFENLPEYRSLVRVMTGVCMSQLRESWSKEDDDLPAIDMHLDEFPQLYRMEPIEDALLYMRSYGVRFWFFCQSVSDLQRHYPDTWRGFIANCGTKCFFGIQDNETAKLVSEMVGAATIRNYSYQAGSNESETMTTGNSSSSGWGSGGYSSNSGSFSSRSLTLGSSLNVTQAYVGRPLIMPDELLRQPFGSMVAIASNMPAIRAQLRFWYEDPELRRRGMISTPPIGPQE